MNRMNRLTPDIDRLERLAVRRLSPYRYALLNTGIDLLRISLGLVFVLFGALKFVPGLSPAEDLATATMRALTFGLVPDSIGISIVAVMETVIGLSLLTGRALRLGLGLLGLTMIGVLSPLVLFPGMLFSGPFNAPTLAAQYVLKDVVLLAAGLVVTAAALVRHPATHGLPAQERETPQPHPIRSPQRDHVGRCIAATTLLVIVAGGVGDASAAPAPLVGATAPGYVAGPKATPVLPRNGTGQPSDATTSTEGVAGETIIACFEPRQDEPLTDLCTPIFTYNDLGLTDRAAAPLLLTGFTVRSWSSGNR